jgi:hypothetical protein
MREDLLAPWSLSLTTSLVATRSVLRLFLHLLFLLFPHLRPVRGFYFLPFLGDLDLGSRTPGAAAAGGRDRADHYPRQQSPPTTSMHEPPPRLPFTK